MVSHSRIEEIHIDDVGGLITVIRCRNGGHFIASHRQDKLPVFCSYVDDAGHACHVKLKMESKDVRRFMRHARRR